MKISRKLTIGYLAVALLVGMMGYLGTQAVAKTQRELDQLVQTAIPIRDELHHLKYRATEIVDRSNRPSHASSRVFSEKLDRSWLQEEFDDSNPAQLFPAIAQAKQTFYKTLVAYEKLADNSISQQLTELQVIKAQSHKLTELETTIVQLRKAAPSEISLAQEEERFKAASQRLILAIDNAFNRNNQTLSRGRDAARRTQELATYSLLCTGLTAIALAFLIGRWVAVSITQPLKKFKAAAIDIGQGRLRTQVDLAEDDELGELAQTFNTMAEELWRTTTYAVKVRESLVESLIVLTPNHLKIHSVNKATCDLLGYHRSELVGQPLSHFLPAVAALLQEAKPKQFSEQGCLYSIETTYEAKGGKQIPVLFSASLMREHEEVLGIVCVAQDNTVRHRHEATIRYQASHDLLTGLPNRAMFDSRLAIALSQAIQNQTQLAVMFLDLDRFKLINDTLGHTIGDRLLQSFSQRISACLRQSDIIARWGGDEFTVLLPNIREVQEVTMIARRILDALQLHFELEGHVLRVTSSIGIAIYPTDGIDSVTLLKNADAALYRAKEGGRNNYCLYYAAAIHPARPIAPL